MWAAENDKVLLIRSKAALGRDIVGRTVIRRNIPDYLVVRIVDETECLSRKSRGSGSRLRVRA